MSPEHVRLRVRLRVTVRVRAVIRGRGSEGFGLIMHCGLIKSGHDANARRVLSVTRHMLRYHDVCAL